MKRLILFLVFPWLTQAQAPSKKLRVLFLGNSYTYVNNMPLLVQDIAKAKGDTLVYDSHAPGGYTFQNHCFDPTSKNKISAGNWDYIVVQAQSQEPSFSPMQVAAQTLPYAIQLDTLIEYYNPCAHIVFYETWGRKNGDASNCGVYPPVCTYSGMQNRLRDSYRLFADTTHGLMAPVGEAWRLFRSQNPSVDLYQADESHPLMEGSYLAAAVIYETVFRKSVLTSTYNPGITAGILTSLNQAAHQLATDSSAITNIPEYDPTISFVSTSLNFIDYQFQSSTPNYIHQWSFGDGSTSVLPDPAHSYAHGGTYTLSLVVYNEKGCKLDSLSQVLIVPDFTGLGESVRERNMLYPNPCKDRLTIRAGMEFENKTSRIALRNMLGQLVYSGEFTGQLDVSSLEAGIYTVKISNGHGQINSCFIKNE